MSFGRSERSPQADLAAPLKDRDHHHICDPDAADEQCHRAQTEEQLTDSSGRSVTGRAAVTNLHKVPAIVVICWNPERGIRMKGEYEELPDGSLRETREIPGGRGVSLFQSAQNLMLASRAHGLGSLFTTFFFLKREAIKQILGIPPNIFMECAVFLGYAEEKLGKPKRLPVPQVSHANRWGTPYVLSDGGS